MSDYHFGIDYDMWLYPPVDWTAPDYDDLPESIEAANIEGTLLVNAEDAIEQVRRLQAENAKLKQELEAVGTAAYLYGRNDLRAENAKLRERIARLEQAVGKMVNYDAEDHHLEIWPDCDVPETILITGRDGELEFSPTVLLDKQTSRSRNLMYLFRKTFDALRAVENEYGLDVMVAHTPVIAAEAKKLGIEVDG